MSPNLLPNLFREIPDRLDDEQFIEILSSGTVRVERIVSTGQSSAPGHWYDQDWNEWVLVLRGAAVLEYTDTPEPHRLDAGDHVTIPAHRKHRVAWTDPDGPTVWLAVHYR